jgi:hypothetical protein
MPKGRTLSPEQVTRLIQSYREAPGVALRAAAAAPCDPRTAKKAWDFGLPSTPGLERPIREQITEEQIATRARLEQQRATQEQTLSAEETERKRQARAAALNDATESRAQEVQMVRLARAGAMQLLGTLTQQARGAGKLGERLRQFQEQLAAKPELSIQEISAASRLINNMSTAMRQASDSAQRAMEMERLLLGEPTSILGIQHFEALTMDEAEARITAAQQALAHAKARGIVLDADPLPASQQALAGKSIH